MKPAEPLTPDLLRLAFDRQRAAFAAEPFPAWPVRRNRLQRLRALIVREQQAIATSIDADFGGRPAIETDLAEVFPSLEEIKGALKHGPSWMRSRRVGVSKWFLPARGEVMPQPLGVVGIIVPWNYPLFLAVGPLAGALAAGNRAMLKLSEFTPQFSALFAELIAREFAAEEITVVQGDATVASQFSQLPFDHLLFTGSTTVGRKVMAAAAPNLTPVTLELGGKSPTVITPGYPLAHAVERILAGKLINAGQTCIAPDYVLVPRGAVDAFIAEARKRAGHMFPGGLADTQYCSIINPRQYARLCGYLDEASSSAVRVEPLFEGASRDDARHRLAPQLLVAPPLELPLMNDEIFGPLLPVVPYDTVDEALQFVTSRPRPLAMYWFDQDSDRTQRALQNTQAGGVCVNETLLHVAQDTLPFGGVGPSGMGHYHGRWGFDTFSKLKPIFWQPRLNAVGLFAPPYPPLARRLLDLMKRF